MGRPKKHEIVLSDLERRELTDLTKSRTARYGLVRRAQIILASSDGETNASIAQRLGISSGTVTHWRRRFLVQGLVGLHGEQRPGRPRSHDDERVAQLLRTVLETAPIQGNRWTVRSLERETGMSKSAVQRFLNLFSVKPHRSKSFKLSTDPLFVEKVRDIVGLYLNPPDKALVLSVDEKTQVQALERSQPVLPLGLGYVDGVTHDYLRHGTTTLFTALDVATGQVIAECKPRHRHQEFLAFLKRIDKNVPADLDVHLIVDNYCTHKNHKVREWLARRPRYHIHYTPTYSSWLNQVERWFALISQQAILRGSFTSTKQLVERIERFVKDHNQGARPFVWTATADSILRKVEKIAKLINGTGH
jgi:putative transposase